MRFIHPAYMTKTVVTVSENSCDPNLLLTRSFADFRQRLNSSIAQCRFSVLETKPAYFFRVKLACSDENAQGECSNVGKCSALRAPQFVPEVPVHFLGPCFNSGLSNYQWLTKCIKHDLMLFFNFVKFCKSIQHRDLWSSKCEIWMTDYYSANTANVLGPGM